MVDTVGTRFTLAGRTAMFNFTSDAPPYHLVWRDYHLPNSTTHVSLEETLHGITTLALDKSRDTEEHPNGSRTLHPELFRSFFAAVSTLQNLISTASCWRDTKDFSIDVEGAGHEILGRRGSFSDIRVTWNILVYRIGMAQERLTKLCFADLPLPSRHSSYRNTSSAPALPHTTTNSVRSTCHVTSHRSALPSPSSDRPSQPSVTSATPHKVTKHDVRMKDKDGKGQERTERVEIERIQVAGGNNVCSTSSASNSSLVGFPAGLLRSSQAPPPPPLAPALPSRARDPPDRDKRAPSLAGHIFPPIARSLVATSTQVQADSLTPRDAAAAHRDGTSIGVVKRDIKETAFRRHQQDSLSLPPTRAHGSTASTTAFSPPATLEERQRTLEDSLSPAPMLAPPGLVLPTIFRSFVDLSPVVDPGPRPTANVAVPPHDGAAMTAVGRGATVEQAQEHSLSLPPARALFPLAPANDPASAFPPHTTREEQRNTFSDNLSPSPALSPLGLTFPTIIRSFVDARCPAPADYSTAQEVAVHHHDSAAITAVRSETTVEQSRGRSLSPPPARGHLLTPPPTSPTTPSPPAIREECRRTLSCNLTLAPTLSPPGLTLPTIFGSFVDSRFQAPANSSTAQGIAIPPLDDAVISRQVTDLEEARRLFTPSPPTRAYPTPSPSPSPASAPPSTAHAECHLRQQPDFLQVSAAATWPPAELDSPPMSRSSTILKPLWCPDHLSAANAVVVNGNTAGNTVEDRATVEITHENLVLPPRSPFLAPGRRRMAVPTAPVSAPSSPAAQGEQANTLSDNLSPSPALSPPGLTFPTIIRSFVDSRSPAPADASTALDVAVPHHDGAAITAVGHKTTIGQSQGRSLSPPPARGHHLTPSPTSPTTPLPPAIQEDTPLDNLSLAPTLIPLGLTVPAMARSLMDSRPSGLSDFHAARNVVSSSDDGATIRVIGYSVQETAREGPQRHTRPLSRIGSRHRTPTSPLSLPPCVAHIECHSHQHDWPQASAPTTWSPAELDPPPISQSSIVLRPLRRPDYLPSATAAVVHDDVDMSAVEHYGIVETTDENPVLPPLPMSPAPTFHPTTPLTSTPLQPVHVAFISALLRCSWEADIKLNAHGVPERLVCPWPGKINSSSLLATPLPLLPSPTCVEHCSLKQALLRTLTQLTIPLAQGDSPPISRLPECMAPPNPARRREKSDATRSACDCEESTTEKQGTPETNNDNLVLVHHLPPPRARGSAFPPTLPAVQLLPIACTEWRPYQDSLSEPSTVLSPTTERDPSPISRLVADPSSLAHADSRKTRDTAVSEGDGTAITMDGYNIKKKGNEQPQRCSLPSPARCLYPRAPPIHPTLERLPTSCIECCPLHIEHCAQTLHTLPSPLGMAWSLWFSGAFAVTAGRRHSGRTSARPHVSRALPRALRSAALAFTFHLWLLSPLGGLVTAPLRCRTLGGHSSFRPPTRAAGAGFETFVRQAHLTLLPLPLAERFRLFAVRHCWHWFAPCRHRTIVALGGSFCV